MDRKRKNSCDNENDNQDRAWANIVHGQRCRRVLDEKVGQTHAHVLHLAELAGQLARHDMAAAPAGPGQNRTEQNRTTLVIVCPDLSAFRLSNPPVRLERDSLLQPH